METGKQYPTVQKYNPTLYKAAKERVHIAERNNRSNILLFGGGDGWYKMGGNSLPIYKYFVCPRNSTKPRVHPDED